MRIVGAVLKDDRAGRPAGARAQLAVCELDLEDPRSGEIRVAIDAAGVCHSDLSVVDGNRPRPLPMLLGHEGTGLVDMVGSDVDDIRPGQRVVMTFLPRCGQCAGCGSGGRVPCEQGTAANAAGELMGGGTRLSRFGRPIRHHLGVSAFATHAVVDRRSVVPVDDDIPPAVAALLGCAVLTGGGAVLNSGRPQSGESVVVVGLGGVGMAATITALALGHEVIAVDNLEAKLELARDLGAAQAVSPARALASGIRAPVVIEAAGHPRAFETAFAMTAPGGRMVTVGLPAPSAIATVSPLLITAEARTIAGSYLGSAVPNRDIPEFVRLWRDGLLPVERLVTSEIGLDQINDAMGDLAGGRTVRQIVRTG
ncbi:alcohol dehydrogenase catalytic domain-containing protein [Mycobacterium sp. DSM 3803]|nr:alcohol dehydrogenase catalytic domain-containing protein [Mycobacterium sp. DSM 3803]OKH77393.1 alcohol dehydrogenase [Mycobacterium sp. SWH-M3]